MSDLCGALGNRSSHQPAERLEVSLVRCNGKDLLGCEAVHLIDVADALVHQSGRQVREVSGPATCQDVPEVGHGEASNPMITLLMTR